MEKLYNDKSIDNYIRINLEEMQNVLNYYMGIIKIYILEKIFKI